MVLQLRSPAESGSNHILLIDPEPPPGIGLRRLRLPLQPFLEESRGAGGAEHEMAPTLFRVIPRGQNYIRACAPIFQHFCDNEEPSNHTAPIFQHLCDSEEPSNHTAPVFQHFCDSEEPSNHTNRLIKFSTSCSCHPTLYETEISIIR